MKRLQDGLLPMLQNFCQDTVLPRCLATGETVDGYAELWRRIWCSQSRPKFSCEGQEFSMTLWRGFLWWQSVSSSHQNIRRTALTRPGTGLARRRCSLFPQMTHCWPAWFPGDRQRRCWVVPAPCWWWWSCGSRPLAEGQRRDQDTGWECSSLLLEALRNLIYIYVYICIQYHSKLLVYLHTVIPRLCRQCLPQNHQGWKKTANKAKTKATECRGNVLQENNGTLQSIV